MTAAPALPFVTAYDASQKRLTLRGATHIAPEVIAFVRDHKVRILDANDGALNALPDDFASLRDLEIAFFSNNRFTRVPGVLASLPKLTMVAFKSNAITEIGDNTLPLSLRWLMLTQNKVDRLPQSIGDLSQLEKVALAGNRLSTLPDSLRNCRKLALLRLSANAFDAAPPAWLFSMPSLAWYSDGGNAFTPHARQDFAIASLPWADLRIDQLINESPSSLVYRAELPDGTGVAAKLFKGDLTSDGYPEDDMRAALAAGAHDNLVRIRARITGHPDGRQGLALGLISSDYKQLGKPPTFDTCSRDSYPDGTRFAPDFTAGVLRHICAAAAHVHARGMMHGDLYAHNILARADGHALLGDFGAASFYDTHTDARQRMDVKAFGYLMDDMITRMDGDAATLPAVRDACLSDDMAVRPSFDALLTRLLL